MSGNGIVRLWDRHFNFLATESCPYPQIRGSVITVEVRGQGVLYDVAKAHILNTRDLHLTYDPNPRNLDDWRNRIGGKVTSITVADHTCECGNPVTTTTFRAVGREETMAEAVQRELEQLARRRAGGVCSALGPTNGPHTKGYVCSLDLGHEGAHVAKIAGHVVDTWTDGIER